MSSPQSTQSMYDQLGGEPRIHRAVERFYGDVLADDVLQPLFGKGQPHHIDHLTAFLSEVFGGPTRYTDELGGFDTILEAHRGLKITDEQRARFVELLDRAARDTGLTHDPALLASFHEYLVFGTEVAQVNSHATSDEELHDCQEVPRWP